MTAHRGNRTVHRARCAGQAGRKTSTISKPKGSSVGTIPYVRAVTGFHSESEADQARKEATERWQQEHGPVKLKHLGAARIHLPDAPDHLLGAEMQPLIESVGRQTAHDTHQGSQAKEPDPSGRRSGEARQDGGEIGHVQETAFRCAHLAARRIKGYSG